MITIENHLAKTILNLDTGCVFKKFKLSFSFSLAIDTEKIIIKSTIGAIPNINSKPRIITLIGFLLTNAHSKIA